MASLLESEEATLIELEKQYKRALNDIGNKIKAFQVDIDMLDAAIQSDGLDDKAKEVLKTQRRSKVYQKQFQEALKGQISGILDQMQGNNYQTIESYLKQTYEDAYIGTMYDLHGQGIPIITPIDQAAAVKAVLTDSKISKGLYTALGLDVAKLKKSISAEITRGIATSLSYADIARNLSNVSKAPLSRARTIVRTEGHRIQQASTMDAQQAAKAKGADVVKQWDAALDGRTRPTHRQLDGQIREVDEPFEVAGKKAMAPGYFNDPAEDCNCRCACLTRARWALDEDELEELKKRAEFFGLDKTKDFYEFKEKFLGVSKMAATDGAINDWSSTKARIVTDEEKADIVEYAKTKGVNIGSLKEFDGDPDLLKAEIDTISSVCKEYGIKKPIKLSAGILDDADFAESHEHNIKINTKALRNRLQTEKNMVNVPGKFAERKLEDIARHELGHVFAFEHGNIGVEIAAEAYYNVYGEKASTSTILKYLASNVSIYSIEISEDKKTNPRYEKPRHFVEVIPEVTVGNSNNPTSFTAEFVRLLMERK